MSVYQLGYQQGIIDYSRDPALKQDELLGTILAGVACTDRSKVRVAKDGDWKTKARLVAPKDDMDVQLKRVAVVGEKIMQVAKRHVDGQLQSLMKDRVGRLPPEVSDDEVKLFRALSHDEEFDKWAKAQRRMAGRWSYVLIDSMVANAFVTEILPQRVFITTSMINQFIENDDEMGLVLGHEVSHLILGHVSEINTLETFLRTLEVLLLSLDPTEGILSIGFMSFLAAVRSLVGAAHSRDNERLADELGIKLAAMACYDTRRASQVFYKMHANDTEHGAVVASDKTSGRSLLSFYDTHPPSDERYLYLMKESEEENSDKYEDSTCASVRKMFAEMLRATRAAHRPVRSGETHNNYEDGQHGGGGGAVNLRAGEEAAMVSASPATSR